MSRLTEYLDKRLYPGIGPNWDDQLFRQEVLAHLAPNSFMLDVGAGAGIVSEMDFSGKAKRVCGIDPDPRVLQNPYLHEAKQALAEQIPYPDNTFDVVIADNVLEHLAAPESVLKEVARVIRPGGVFLAKTPNKNHYMPLIARVTPHSFHRLVNRWRGRRSVDTFPTLYRINDCKTIRSYAEKAGLVIEKIILTESRPEYLRLNATTYLLGWAYERIVNSLPALARFRVSLIVVFRKTS